MTGEINLKGATNKFLAQISGNLGAYMEACLHCGACADACHFYEVTKDPRYTPAYKLFPMARAYKRSKPPLSWFGTAPKTTEKDLREWEELLFDSCTMCGRCTMVCPMGIDMGPDGSLYVADNQGWPGKPEGQNEGRILKLKIANGKVEQTEVIASGMSHPNAVKYYKGKIWVTQSMLPAIESEQLVSAVYRFDEKDRNVQLKNDRSDKNLLVEFKTLNMDCQYGLDGMSFDSQGNLFVGNFGDGTLHKVTFDENGAVKTNEVFAKSPNMRTIDGICMDAQDNIYVADFSENAVCKVTPSGEVTVLARSPDCDGSKGGLDQPGEPILRGNELIISNFDMVTGPDKVNTAHDAPYTMSVIHLDKIK